MDFLTDDLSDLTGRHCTWRAARLPDRSEPLGESMAEYRMDVLSRLTGGGGTDNLYRQSCKGRRVLFPDEQPEMVGGFR